MTPKQTIKRNADAYLKNASPRHTFTSICNNLLQSVVVADGKPVMSLDTMGFVAFMLSQEVHWKLHLNWAKQKLQIGDRVLKRIFRESKAAGFSKVERDKDAEGRYTGSVTYYFTDIPFSFADGKAISDETSPMDKSPASISDEIHKGRFATCGEMYPPYKEKKEDRKNKQNRNTLTSFECTGAEAREEPVEVDFQEIKKALPAQRKAAKREIAVTLSRKRQPDLPMAVDPQRTMLDAQVEEGLRLWKEAMGDLWAGIRVSKTQKSQMRSLIQAEGFEYVQALGEALKTMQFGRGQNGGWILELCDLLNKEDKRQAVFSKYQRASHAVPSAFQQRESNRQALRQMIAENRSSFPSGKRVGEVFGCWVEPEHANRLLKEVPGATCDHVEEALIAATREESRIFGVKDGYGKAQIGPVLDWCKNRIGWQIAIATHGNAEKLAGGKVATINPYDSPSDGVSFTSDNGRIAVSQAFLDQLRNAYPLAWAKLPHDYWRGAAETGDYYLQQAFEQASRKISWTNYGPESQKAVHEALIAWAIRTSEMVAERQAEQAEAERRLAEKTAAELEEANRKAGMQWTGAYWRIFPEIKAWIKQAYGVTDDALRRVSRQIPEKLSPSAARQMLEEMILGELVSQQGSAF